MDFRWQPLSPDSKRQVKIVLHPTASIWEVRRGLDPGSDDSVDLSEFVKDASQSVFELNVTLAFNRELFGDFQPKPLQVLELQLYQSGEWKPLWIGNIAAINSFTMQRGERQMQLLAKTRDQEDIWRNSPRVTPLFPLLTNLTYMIQYIARSANMQGDEIALPPSAVVTAHANTQLADMTAWDMVSSICVALGWTPFIDGQGRLRAANRDMQGRTADATLTDDRMVKVGGQRQRAPYNRVRVQWLDPALKMWMQQGRKVADIHCTVGWWQTYHTEKVKFSADGTQRVSGTYLKQIQGLNNFIQFCTEEWTQQTPNQGKFHVNNEINFALVLSLMGFLWKQVLTRSDHLAGSLYNSAGTLSAEGFSILVSVATVTGVVIPLPGEVWTVPTLPQGSIGESLLWFSFFAALMNIGTGIYEVWGVPYEFVHAKNISEAFDSSVPTWVNNVNEIQCDFIMNEEHAKAVAIRELIYSAQSVNKWSVTIVDDPRIEFGDILQFPDGSQLFVEDFTRSVARGSEATLDIKGFLTGRRITAQAKPITVTGGTPDIGIGLPGGPGGGPAGGAEGGGGAGGPSSGPGSKTEPIVPMSADPGAFEDQCKRSLAYFHRTDFSYWRGLCHPPDPWQAGDSKWYQGWDAYMEQRAVPNQGGSADHALLPRPAVHQDPVPAGYPKGGWT